MNNFFFYRFASSNLFAFIPWDKSEAFKNVGYGIFHNIGDVPPSEQNRLMMRVLSYPDLNNLYVETLLEGSREQLVASLDEALLGLRPRPQVSSTSRVLAAG